MESLIQCIPNFSEGRRPDVIKAIVDCIQHTTDVRLVDWSADYDHNRMVVTFIGSSDAVMNASLAATEIAIDSIDINQHKGVHPRIGAVDVLPFVPIRNIDMEGCSEIAMKTGKEIAKRFNIPIFFYEYASPDRHTLPNIRKNAFKSYKPDIGPINPHPKAGGIVIGARNPLIAYNVMLQTPDVTAARMIANELRDNEISGFIGIRALGLLLPSRNITQVSMNISQPEITSIFDVFKYICNRAMDYRVAVIGSEVIGALPGFTAFQEIKESLMATSLNPGQILLENWPD